MHQTKRNLTTIYLLKCKQITPPLSVIRIVYLLTLWDCHHFLVYKSRDKVVRLINY